MKKRIRYIIALILVANLAIILFQGYWLNNSYHLNKQRFEQATVNALKHVVTKVMISGSRKILFKSDSLAFTFESHTPTFLSQSPTFSDSNHHSLTFFTTARSLEKMPILDTNELDGLKKGQRGIRAIIRSDSSDNDAAFMKMDVEDMVEQFIATLIHQQLDLEQTDSLYQKELKKLGIKTTSYLNFYKNDSLILTTNKVNINPKYQTPMVEANPSNGNIKYGVKAAFINPMHYVFSKMWGILLASLLLIGLTIGSFAYMLRVIFQQKRLSEVKNDFINNMTHEFKTPISIIAATNEALTGFNVLDDREKTKRYLHISKNELTRLSGMVEKVLNIAQFEKEDFALSLETTNLNELLQSLTARYQINESVEIIYQNHLQTAVTQLDPIHFGNVLNNLLDNAIKYSKDKAKVVICTFEDAKNIIIEIKDNGIGISKQDQKLIFDKFYRVSTGDLHKVKGFGLGLSYVKNMVEQHGGMISVQSELEKGSTFTIQLPKSNTNE